MTYAYTFQWANDGDDALYISDHYYRIDDMLEDAAYAELYTQGERQINFVAVLSTKEDAPDITMQFREYIDESRKAVNWVLSNGFPATSVKECLEQYEEREAA